MQSISANRGQQKRMVANAVASLAEVRQQRNNREARSLTWWNEMKKAIVKQYPDGRQEIVVPQILTPEQEHYQFPPRSKFLKQLQAAEMAEKRRDSSTINLSRIASARGLAEEQSVSVFYKIGSVYQNSSSNLNKNNRTIPPLDESTLKEWFTKNTKKPVSRKSKDRAVADWINEVERSKQISPSVSKKRPANKLSLASYFEGAFSHSTKMQFKSAAGKRWANILDINATLAPPNEACKVHYIPRKLLRLSCGMERKNISNTGTNDNAPVASTTISKIRELWKEYKRTIPSNITSFENKITTLVLTATEETTPLAALVHLLLQSHNDSDPLKDKSQEPRKTVMNLEIQLSIERRKRQEILQKLVATETLDENSRIGKITGR
ncbi:hypothetical protein BDF20DRAFT_620359 [Mycotypha africana]|uniref:uncharacterized protein n=1 Tax=Mycotypha africana TaxID=64632 RepID=UPI0023014665|nr:uncharacterized protein BDF20DRAFT_620359 [Mycotypha africana]KAI8975616.1 hypothetical protein BDF20DRAFT_620359 [Mycotypha africana]